MQLQKQAFKKISHRCGGYGVSTITTSLQNGVAVALAGFGTFERTFRGERTGYNPQTRKPMMIAASYSVRFKLAKKG